MKTRIDLSKMDLPLPAVSKENQIAEIISRFEDQQFTTKHILAAVKLHADEYPALSKGTGESTLETVCRKVIARLIKQGSIKVCYKIDRGVKVYGRVE